MSGLTPVEEAAIVAEVEAQAVEDGVSPHPGGWREHDRWRCDRCHTVNDATRYYCVECQATCEYVSRDSAVRPWLPTD